MKFQFSKNSITWHFDPWIMDKNNQLALSAAEGTGEEGALRSSSSISQVRGSFASSSEANSRKVSFSIMRFPERSVHVCSRAVKLDLFGIAGRSEISKDNGSQPVLITRSSSSEFTFSTQLVRSSASQSGSFRAADSLSKIVVQFSKAYALFDCANKASFSGWTANSTAANLCASASI